MGNLISKFLPPWWPFAAIGILLVVLGGGLLALKHSWQAQALQENKLKQIAADQALSAEAIAIRDARLIQVEAQAAAARRKIDNAPVTTSCGSVMRDTADSVQQLLGKKP
jgi:hypothetical protein